MLLMRMPTIHVFLLVTIIFVKVAFLLIFIFVRRGGPFNAHSLRGVDALMCMLFVLLFLGMDLDLRAVLEFIVHALVDDAGSESGRDKFVIVPI